MNKRDLLSISKTRNGWMLRVKCPSTGGWMNYGSQPFETRVFPTKKTAEQKATELYSKGIFQGKNNFWWR